MAKVLICEDDITLANAMTRSIKTLGHDVETVNKGQDCLDSFNKAFGEENPFQLVLLDQNLPDMKGSEILSHIKKTNPSSKIMMVTGATEVDLVVDCMKNGAYNFIKKPFEQKILNSAIAEALGSNKVYETQQTEIGKLTTKSEVFEEIIQTMDKIAKKNITVLLSGESGTGKDFIARYIYSLWDDEDKPYIAVNCPAIPITLAESELFGHEKGAFTGAIETKKGKFELANNGVLFLDEVADLNHEVQAKLLRVLESRSLERVGSSKNIKFNLQLISASSRSLKNQVDSGDFRLDLYYRLADIEIKIPSLRERLEDLEALIFEFTKQYANENNESPRSLSSSLMEKLKTYRWPGNIRELKSVIRRILILSDKEIIDFEDLPPTFFEEFESVNHVIDKDDISIKSHEKKMIVDSIEKHNGNMSKAAEELGIGRATLYRKIKKYDIPT